MRFNNFKKWVALSGLLFTSTSVAAGELITETDVGWGFDYEITGPVKLMETLKSGHKVVFETKEASKDQVNTTTVAVTLYSSAFGNEIVEMNLLKGIGIEGGVAELSIHCDQQVLPASAIHTTETGGLRQNSYYKFELGANLANSCGIRYVNANPDLVANKQSDAQLSSSHDNGKTLLAIEGTVYPPSADSEYLIIQFPLAENAVDGWSDVFLISSLWSRTREFRLLEELSKAALNSANHRMRVNLECDADPMAVTRTDGALVLLPGEPQDQYGCNILSTKVVFD